MKRKTNWMRLGYVVSACLLFTGLTVTAANDTAQAVPQEIVVLYEEEQEEKIRAFAQEKGDDFSEEYASKGGIGVAVINTNGVSAEKLAKEYQKKEEVIAASPNYELELFGFEETNDPMYPQQIHLYQEAAEHAWKLVAAVPHQKVKVAVLDTGADITHPDLRGCLNMELSKEILDEKGTLGPLKGDGFEHGVPTASTKSHGTHVCGIIAAEAGNAEGIAGAASVYDNSVVDLIVVDIFSKERTTSLAHLIQGLEYARACGVKVVNLSLGLQLTKNIDDSVLRAECERLHQAGITLVCAAGNHGRNDNGGVSVVPGDYEQTIGVIAVDAKNQRLSTSNYGKNKDLSAPGNLVFSTIQGGKYGVMSGTSMAAPSVTAAVAMMCSIDDTLTPNLIRDILLKNATDIGSPGFDVETAAGLVSFRRSIKAVIPAEGLPGSLPYQDVKRNDWFFEPVKELYRYRLMTGLNASMFGPTENICRGQIAVILHRYAGAPNVTYQGSFPDVPEGEFYTEAVEWAAMNGIVKGYEDTGLFGPGDDVNREQLATILYRYAKEQGYVALPEGDLSIYPDAQAVHEFAQEAFQWAVGKQIIKGYEDGTLSPQHTAMRAVCATMFSRFMEGY